MYTIPRRRWPKGAWMRLVSRERLVAFVGFDKDNPRVNATKKMSNRELALRANVSNGFIDHLTSGRRSSCKPETARRIAEALEVPIDVLFVVHVPSTSTTGAKRQEVAA